MDASRELSQFLTSRRGRVTPQQAGLPTYGQRRVPGLRREEVASLGGVSVEYYKRLERGNATGASDQVLEALADALRLDDAERAHLFDLARAASPIAPRRRSRPAQQRVRPAIQRILDSITAPATVSNMRCDYLAANQLGRALYAPLFETREQPPNGARFTFLDPAAQEFFLDWEKAAKDLVAALRSIAAARALPASLSSVTGATVNQPEGVAIDVAAGRIFRFPPPLPSAASHKRRARRGIMPRGAATRALLAVAPVVDRSPPPLHHHSARTRHLDVARTAVRCAAFAAQRPGARRLQPGQAVCWS